MQKKSLRKQFIQNIWHRNVIEMAEVCEFVDGRDEALRESSSNDQFGSFQDTHIHKSSFYTIVFV